MCSIPDATLEKWIEELTIPFALQITHIHVISAYGTPASFIYKQVQRQGGTSMTAKIKDDAPYKDFAERLTKLRKKAGLTRAQLGEKIGVSGRSIINYENGERIPFGDVCVRMAEVFGITVDALLGVEKPDVEMAKAKALEEMRLINGKRGVDRLRNALDVAQGVMAGGYIDDSQMAEFSYELSKMALLAQDALRKKYTSDLYAETKKRKSEETNATIRKINQEIGALTEPGFDINDGFLDDEDD